jgi:hypothetical protein
VCRRCLVSGVWCPDGVWCLVSGGVLPLMKPPYWWVLSDAKFGSVVLWEGADDPPVWAVAKTAAGAGLLLVGVTAAEPRLNGGRPPHGGKKVASFLPKIHSNLLKILPEKFPLRPVSVDHPNLVYINCTPTTANFSCLCCLEVVVLWLETKATNKVSMKWRASLAPARAEIETGVLAKADQ